VNDTQLFQFGAVGVDKWTPRTSYSKCTCQVAMGTFDRQNTCPMTDQRFKIKGGSATVPPITKARGVATSFPLRNCV